jgi:hypothetical protein
MPLEQWSVQHHVFIIESLQSHLLIMLKCYGTSSHQGWVGVELSCWLYRVLSESSRTVIIVTASVKEDERGGKGRTSASLLHQSATWHHAVNTYCFSRVLFDFVFRFVCDGWQNGATYLHQVCVKLGKFATETLEMLREAFCQKMSK